MISGIVGPSGAIDKRESFASQKAASSIRSMADTLPRSSFSHVLIEAYFALIEKLVSISDPVITE